MDSEKAFFRPIYIKDEDISTGDGGCGSSPGVEKPPSGAGRRLWKLPGSGKKRPHRGGRRLWKPPGGVEKTPRRGAGGCGSPRGWEKTPPQGAGGCGSSPGVWKNAPTGRQGQAGREAGGREHGIPDRRVPGGWAAGMRQDQVAQRPGGGGCGGQQAVARPGQSVWRVQTAWGHDTAAALQG